MILSLYPLALGLTLAISARPVCEWPSFTPRTPEFKIKMPGLVDERTNFVDTDAGGLRQSVFTCQSGLAFYQVSFVDLDLGDLKNQNDAENLLLAVQASARTSEKDTVFAEGSGRKNGCLWRRFRCSSVRGPMVSHFVLLQGQRFYHLEVVAPPSNWRKAQAKDFFETFEPTSP